MATETVVPADKQAANDHEVLLDVKNLVMHFPLTQGIIFQRKVGAVQAVDGVSFNVRRGETLGLVGESGCGKSTTGRAILQLYKPTSGEVIYQGRDLTKLDGGDMRKMRRHLQMIFQDPYASLNPRMTVGSIISEPMQIHNLVPRDQRNRRVQELLETVGLNPYFANRYPHEFSGGQRQRIGVARALAASPDFIVADEPVSALDVSIQAQIIGLLKRVCRERGAAVMLITHDMGVIAETCDRVAVMYAGRVAEIGPVHEVINHPAHPYTVGLMASIPDMEEDRETLNQIDGAMPRLNAIPRGCAFNPRCPRVFERCRVDRPDLLPAGATQAACWLHARQEVTA